MLVKEEKTMMDQVYGQVYIRSWRQQKWMATITDILKGGPKRQR